MLKAIKTIKTHRGLIHITWHGTIWIQQGRPHGVMANPGEVMLNLEDLDSIRTALDELRATGWEPVPEGSVIPL